jgi:phosphoribosyl 1,2-cyclic phosphodiesterase
LRYKFLVVDDDEAELGWVSVILRAAGHEVAVTRDSRGALAQVLEHRPDCVIADLMMPEIDGMELLVQIRSRPELAETKVIIISGKIYEFDEKRARELGADGYIKKPLDETFVETVTTIMVDLVEVRYWGVRGTLPVSGERTLKYGGNTSCVTVELPGQDLVIFDAGSGIRELGDHLLGRPGRLNARLFISHPHWDHINAIPFFAPLYVQGNDIEILGPAQATLGMRELISAQMEGVYFPITVREWSANVKYRDMREETISIGDVVVRARLLAHPGYCLGYRLEYHGRSVCYVTDNELFLAEHRGYNAFYVEQLTKFVWGTDLLITDTTYTDEAYRSKVGWGHSCVSQVVELAHQAEVARLHLFHHDPSEDDDAIDAKLAQALAKGAELGTETEIDAPTQGSVLRL